MGAQLSTRAAVLLGTNFVCAHAGDEIKRIASTSFFIALSRGTGAIWLLLNRIGPGKSNDVMASNRQQSGSIAYHNFDGIAADIGGRERLVRDLGSHEAMIQRNDELLVVVRTIPATFNLLFRGVRLRGAGDGMSCNTKPTLPPRDELEWSPAAGFLARSPERGDAVGCARSPAFEELA
jgi:hypothetical protein